MKTLILKDKHTPVIIVALFTICNIWKQPMSINRSEDKENLTHTHIYIYNGIFPGGSGGKQAAHNAGDLGSIPGLGRSPGEGKGYPLQYSSLENSMDCIVQGVTKSWTRLSDFHFYFYMGYSVQFSSVAQSCPTLCDPINCSMPGLPVHHQLPEFTQTHIRRVSDAIQPSHPLLSPSPPAPNPSQHHSLFQ